MGYFYLALTIACEMTGTTMLKYSKGLSVLLPSAGAILAYVACYFFFSKTLVALPLNMAYPMWAGIGIAVTTLVSVVLFQERLTGMMLFGIASILVGVVVLNIPSS